MTMHLSPLLRARREARWCGAAIAGAALLGGWWWYQPPGDSTKQQLSTAHQRATADPYSKGDGTDSNAHDRRGPWLPSVERDPEAAPAPTPEPDLHASPWRLDPAVREPDPGLLPAAQLKPPPPDVPPPPPASEPPDPATHTPSLHNPGGVNGDRPARAPGGY